MVCIVYCCPHQWKTRKINCHNFVSQWYEMYFRLHSFVWRRHPSETTCQPKHDQALVCHVSSLHWADLTLSFPPPLAADHWPQDAQGRGVPSGRAHPSAPPWRAETGGADDPGGQRAPLPGALLWQQANVVHVHMFHFSSRASCFHSRVSACALCYLAFGGLRKINTNLMVSDHYLHAVTGIRFFFLLWNKCTYRTLRSVLSFQGELGLMWFKGRRGRLDLGHGFAAELFVYVF